MTIGYAATFETQILPKTLVNYPNRKTMWIVIAAIAVVVVCFAFVEYRGSFVPNKNYVAPLVSTTSDNGSSTVIADNDWQKVLVGAGVSPSKSGSLDAGTKASQTQPVLTETEKLGQALISKYLQLQQSGAVMSTDTISSMVSGALSNPSIAPAAKVYSFSDIKIGKDDSVNASAAYGQKVGRLFESNNALGNELVYARDSEEKNDPTILENIDPVIASYKNILGGLLSIVATPSLAKTHLDLINAMSERLMVAQLLRNINNDPAAGLQGAGKYMSSMQDFGNALAELKQYLDFLKANFSATTTGSVSGLNNI